MTNLEELRMKIKFSDRLTESESSTVKARAIIEDLIQDYNLGDIREAGKKLQIEASRVMNFLEIAFDYVISVDNELKAIQDELDTRELRKLCVASGELEPLPHEVA